MRGARWPAPEGLGTAGRKTWRRPAESRSNAGEPHQLERARPSGGTPRQDPPAREHHRVEQCADVRCTQVHAELPRLLVDAASEGQPRATTPLLLQLQAIRSGFRATMW